MRNLRRNQQTVQFKRFISKTEILDDYGNPIGSFETVYGALEKADLCVSPNKGDTTVQQFGSLEDYDRSMTTADTACGIDENAILWLDGADTTKPHNYIVKKRAPWKNSVSYAIKKVTVS